MTDKQPSKIIAETSPSIQTHLGMLQGVIERMASNSNFAKAWCITIVSAILVVVADKDKPDYALLALLPTILFMALDAYYLGMEKGFRNSYNDFIKKLHEGNLTLDDLFCVSPRGGSSKLQGEAFKSFSVWGFYFVLIALIVIARNFVL